MLRKLLPIVGSVAKRQVTIIGASNVRHNSSSKSSVYEPDYLDSLKPEFPQYENLVVQIKGYDYPILESYQRYLHGVAEYLDIDVSECYALPPQNTHVQRMRPNSVVIDAEYDLTIYERNLQISDVDSPTYPIFLRVAQAALPEGVQLCVQELSDELEERRYVPDRDLLELKTELERMQSSSTSGKKK